MNIYNGLVLKENNSMMLAEYIKSVRIELIEAARRDYLIDLAKTAQRLYIGMSVGVGSSLMDVCLNEHRLADALGRDPRSPKWETCMPKADEIMEIAKIVVDSKRLNYRLRPYVTEAALTKKYNAEITVYPIRDKILLIPDTVNKTFDYAMSHSVYTDTYFYWDEEDGDPADNVQKEEWKRRAIDWHEAFSHPVKNRILGYESVENGFVVNLLDANKDINVRVHSIEKEIAPHFISDRTCIARAVEKKMKNDYYEEIVKATHFNEVDSTWKEKSHLMERALERFACNKDIYNQKIEELCEKINSKRFFADSEDFWYNT